MGVVLDSTVFIAAERAGSDAKDILNSVRSVTRDEKLVASVITVSEMSFGLARAEATLRYERRKRFLQDIQGAFEFLPVTAEMAFTSGILRATLQLQGMTVDISDLLIASTALELDYAVGTANVRHFRRVPGLRVVEL